LITKITHAHIKLQVCARTVENSVDTQNPDPAAI
jgi:hypothetical protein